MHYYQHHPQLPDRLPPVLSLPLLHLCQVSFTLNLALLLELSLAIRLQLIISQSDSPGQTSVIVSI